MCLADKSRMCEDANSASIALAAVCHRKITVARAGAGCCLRGARLHAYSLGQLLRQHAVMQTRRSLRRLCRGAVRRRAAAGAAPPAH